MSLLSVIQSYPDKTSQQVLDDLSTTTDGPFDSTPYTWSGLCQKLLAAGVNPGVVLNAVTIIRALPNGGATLDACLSSGGFDCSNATNRALLQASEISDPPEAVAIVEAMLAIGRPTLPQWQLSGLEALPTLEQIQSAIDTQATADWISRVRDIINAAVGTSASIASLKTTIAGL